MKLIFIEISACGFQTLSSFSFQSFPSQGLLAMGHIIPWQRVGSVIKPMVLTLLCQFHECTYVLQTLSLHFWKWLYSHSLLFWMKLWMLIPTPLYSEFAASLFCLLWSHSTDPGILWRTYFLPVKFGPNSFTWYVSAKSSVLAKCLKNLFKLEFAI